MSTFDGPDGCACGRSESTESLPGRSSRVSGWSSSTMPKKRRRSASFAQATFRAQALENRALPVSPLTFSHINDSRDFLFQETKHTLVQRDNWPDDPVTEAHARRLTEAMIRVCSQNPPSPLLHAIDNILSARCRQSRQPSYGSVSNKLQQYDHHCECFFNLDILYHRPNNVNEGHTSIGSCGHPVLRDHAG